MINTKGGYMKKIFLGLMFLAMVSANLYAQDNANIEIQDNTNAGVQDNANAEAQSDAGAYAGEGFGGVDWQKFEDSVWVKMQAKGMGEAEFHQGLAYSYITKEFGNQSGRAIDHFKKAVELDPNLYLSWYTLGLYFVEEEKGQEYFQKAIEADPNYAPPYYWLGYLYCQVRKDDQALSFFEKYLELVQQDDLKEARRIPAVMKIVEELRSGTDGEFLKTLRKQEAPAATIGQIPPTTQ